jgi:hypothetical protein
MGTRLRTSLAALLVLAAVASTGCQRVARIIPGGP